MFEPHVKAQNDYKNVLMLSYYRNNLCHLFVNEAFIAASLLAFGEQSCQEEGVYVHRVRDHASFCADLFREEFVVREKLSDMPVFEETLLTMQGRGFVSREGDTIRVSSLSAIKFLASILNPFIESYWVTFCFMAHARQSFSMQRVGLSKKVQHLAEILYSEGTLVHYECCSLETIGNALQKLATLKIVSALGDELALTQDQVKEKRLNDLFE
mmetsp:Transcript_23364/g.17792  ORF Transcript_23364/g.17792 Transcript_23364/m.17792 type:complete len:213 (+) Transcript_23364:116-754(+)